MGFFNKSIIGMELDSQEIRAVEIKGSAKKPSIAAWGRIKLPEGVVKDGRVVDQNVFTAHLDQLLSENSFKGREVVLGVNNQDIIVRFASFPKVPEDKIKNMIRFQAQDYIPVSLDELELDYILVGEKNTAEGDFLNVILVGARKKMLNDFIDAFTASKLTIRDIDLTMFALGRAALIGSNDGTFALAGYNNDIGNILIFKNGLLGMARSVSISQSPIWNSFGNMDNDKTEIDQNSIADILFGEIKSSVGYYKMQNNETIENILLLGCGAKQDQVAKRLAETTDIAVSIPEPYNYLENGVTKGLRIFKASEYTASISLALRGLGA